MPLGLTTQVGSLSSAPTSMATVSRIVSATSPSRTHDRQHGGGAEHLSRRRQHEQRREAAEDEEGRRKRAAGIGAEPEPDEKRSAEYHDSECHGGRVGPASDGGPRWSPSTARTCRRWMNRRTLVDASTCPVADVSRGQTLVERHNRSRGLSAQASRPRKPISQWSMPIAGGFISTRVASVAGLATSRSSSSRRLRGGELECSSTCGSTSG